MLLFRCTYLKISEEEVTGDIVKSPKKMVGNTYTKSVVPTPNPTHFRESMVRCILAPVSPLLFEMEVWKMEMCSEKKERDRQRE